MYCRNFGECCRATLTKCDPRRHSTTSHDSGSISATIVRFDYCVFSGLSARLVSSLSLSICSTSSGISPYILSAYTPGKKLDKPSHLASHDSSGFNIAKILQWDKRLRHAACGTTRRTRRNSTLYTVRHDLAVLPTQGRDSSHTRYRKIG